MKTLYKSALLFILLLAVPHFRTMIAQQESASPTPTYDPLVEPTLPPNPTEYELGGNLYWHWCMTCHGDRGQGLTDEFRGIWEPEHQNCWGRGCHAGRPGDEGFPIPTVVPALVNENHLARFSSIQKLADFLKATHPPQSPGMLKTEEYHAIAFFVFTLNKRPPVSAPITEPPIPAATPTRTLSPSEEAISRTPPGNAVIILVILGSILLVLTIKKLHVQR